MAKLTSKERKRIPAKDFAGPGRTYPDENRSHAVAAKGRATEMWEKGKISKSEMQRIHSKANEKLRRK